MVEILGPQSRGIRILLVDSKPIERQLLEGALTHQGFEVIACGVDTDTVVDVPERADADVMIVNCAGDDSAQPQTAVLRSLHASYPQIAKVALLQTENRQAVVQAFRAGARGIFALSESSFSLLCECIVRVHSGDISASSRQLNYLLDSVCQVPSVRVLGTVGQNLLTFREEQVVALVADGLSNHAVAIELGLSEHTVKKYLFRIFDKLGISNRVELVLYAFHHGAPQTADWAAQA